VNGAQAKSSKEVKTGDTITIRRNRSVVTAKVMKLPAAKQVSKSQAPELVEIISSETLAEDQF
jgi:ribosomal 50S subunit-recycling heat shock protein